MVNKINQWLLTLSSYFENQQWYLHNYQCQLHDGSGLVYITMEYLPEANVLLLASPLADVNSVSVKSNNILADLFSLNSNERFIGQAWVAIGGEVNNQYLLLSSLHLDKCSYTEFVSYLTNHLQLSKSIQEGVIFKEPSAGGDMSEQGLANKYVIGVNVRGGIR